MQEACDIVEDAGGWGCRSCGAWWPGPEAPSACAAEEVRGAPTWAAIAWGAVLGVMAILIAVHAGMGATP